jgi:YesN/AraC family two-component response regulator
MLKVMIVDDEKSIRNILKNIISREFKKIKIVGEAASGIEAINIIDELLPDILFVDIKMPFMDGIRLSNIIIKRYPKIKIIVLTAFDEFDYARKCLRIGVCEYLLKPVVRDEIKNSLNKIIINLSEEKINVDNDDYYVKDNHIIDNIKIYIENNYKKYDINLNLISQLFGFNTSYLSRLFKKETGQNLTDYIIKCRMEKAIEYAKEGKFMYVTAKNVGIPDPNYFGKCFKKYTKKTYSDYINKN